MLFQPYGPIKTLIGKFLSKIYKKFIAINQISFKVKKEVIELLVQMVQKTTLLKIIANLLNQIQEKLLSKEKS